MSSIRSRTRRFKEQEWLIDLAIGTAGPEWDQARVAYITNPLGMNMAFERKVLNDKLKNLDEYVPLFLRLAKLREKHAHEEEEKGHHRTAGDSYLAAALLYGGAAWPIWEDGNETLLEIESKMEELYDKFGEHANHSVERVRIPFRGTYLSGLLHLPQSYDGSKRLGCLVSIPGMDSFKETLVCAHGDKMLSRNFAVLAVDGPGQGESLARKIKVEQRSFDEAGQAMFDFASKHKSIDGKKIAIQGVSMGSYWALRAAAGSKGFSACSSFASCYEPGMVTIFNKASPTFKERFMWMTGIEEEERFDEFAASMDLNQVLGNIGVPTLLTVGSNDHLSPLRYAYDVYDKIHAPKTLDIYIGEKHRVNHPFAEDRRADWIIDRVSGKQFDSSVNELPQLN